jgi:hypothetical protein
MLKSSLHFSEGYFLFIPHMAVTPTSKFDLIEEVSVGDNC